jgi:polysaccharide pyruvyl transferase WcaK-like protein
MKVITVLGWYHKHNAGDESYKIAFPLLFPDYEFRFVDFLDDKSRKESDAFILGGGDVVSNGFLDQMNTTNKPKHIFSTTVSKEINPDKLSQYESIIVRDKKSAEILKYRGVESKLCPDAAFILSGDKMRGRRLIRKYFNSYGKDLYQKTVVVTINGYLSRDEDSYYDVRKFVSFHSMVYELTNMIDTTNASFIFVPFGQSLPWDDRVTNFWVGAKCKYWKKNLVLLNEPTVQDILDIFSAADAAISTRLHSTIFSCATMTPFVDITHNHKNRWLLETINKTDWSIPFNAFDGNKCKSLINSFIQKPEDSKKELEALINKQRATLKGLDVRFI